MGIRFRADGGGRNKCAWRKTEGRMKKILTDIKLNVGQEERELWKLAEKHLAG